MAEYKETTEDRATRLFFELKKSGSIDVSAEVITRTLKEEQKITRHACAEVVMGISSERAVHISWNMAIHEAHQAIMNVNTEKE